MENWDFWPYEKFSFLWSKKVSFLFRRQRNSLVSYFDKKIKFFFGLLDLNCGLTPLENCNFWLYEKFSFLWSKKVSFLFRTSRNAIQLKELVLTSVTTGEIEQSV